MADWFSLFSGVITPGTLHSSLMSMGDCCLPLAHIMKVPVAVESGREVVVKVDVSVVDVKAIRVETVATGGDARLGGVDFDEAFARYLADLFARSSGGVQVGPSSDEPFHGGAWSRLLAAAETARVELSVRTSATVHLGSLASGHALGPSPP